MYTLNPDKHMPWEQGRAPVSWAAFLAAVERFCQAHGWEIDYDSIDDHSCVIFAYPEQTDEQTAAAPDYVQDDLPF